MEIKECILQKINNKNAIIGIIGLGYVGLPLALRFAKSGFEVVGIDIDESKISFLSEEKSYLSHIQDSEISLLVKNGFSASNDFSIIERKDVDIIILCLPTPLNRNRDPDLSYIESTINGLFPYLRPGHVISLESTTYPGTTEEFVLPKIEKSGLKVGKDIFLVYSPEREDPGNKHHNTHTIPKICSGHTKICLDIGLSLYSAVVRQVVSVSSTKTAEMTKLLENIYRAVNIGLINEMKIVADAMSIDIHEVIEAAATKPFGFTPYYPGPGLGGHCIPVDPFYLTWKAREYGLHTRFIELAGEINAGMPNWVVSKIAEALNRERKSIKGSKILVVGLAYKSDIGDTRESPSVILIKKLNDSGALVSYHDSYVPVFPKMRDIKFDLSSVNLTQETLSDVDCVVIATAHSNVDYSLIKNYASSIVDTRGVYCKYNQSNITKA